MLHLLFADDLLFFAKANDNLVDCTLEGLKSFSRALCQSIAHSKSLIFFSSNLDA